VAVMRIELKDDFCKFRGKGDEKDNPEEESKDIDVSVKVHTFSELTKHQKKRADIKTITFLCHFRNEVARVASYPPFLSDALAPLMPNSKVEQVREAGHSVYFQRASIFNQLVDRFLAAAG
jgi:hypothetical protein